MTCTCTGTLPRGGPPTHISSAIREWVAKKNPYIEPVEETTAIQTTFLPWRARIPRRRDNGLVQEIVDAYTDDEVLDLIDPPDDVGVD